MILNPTLAQTEGMILTLRENSVVATLHQICKRNFKPICHLVGPAGNGVFLPGFCYSFGEKDIFKNKIRHIGSNFLLSAKIFNLVRLEKTKKIGTG